MGFENEVVVIGADHHNTLAVIRDLGKNGCKIHVVIHGNHSNINDVCCADSRFAKKCISIVNDSVESIIEWLNAYAAADKKLLFPCSDLAAYSIDKHSNRLREYYFFPGFIGSPGKVALLMDKMEQKKYAEKNGIPMPDTWKLVNIKNKFEGAENIPFPCILKPVISAFGKRSNIMVCQNIDEYQCTLNKYIDDGIQEILVQRFIKKSQEILSYGCLVSDKKKSVGATIWKIRESSKGGTLFAKFIDDPKVTEIQNKVLDVLYSDGYRGQYDIEYLVCDDKVYLNEINFRHSGNGYGLVNMGIDAPYIGCLEMLAVEIPYSFFYEKINIIGKTHMDEINDFRCRKDNNVPLLKWIIEFIGSSSYSTFCFYDLSGTWSFYKKRVRHLLNKLKIKSLLHLSGS